jgi:signal peptidase I
MRAHRQITRLLWGALGLALVGLLWFFFAPTALGGSATYVVTDGVSMEPRFHSGDLALVRSESDYRVGEIVAYHNRQLGTVVLHRIIGRDGSRYVFKGDNNNFQDFEHPTRSQLIGALWVHVPGAGRTLNSIRSPALIAVLFAFGTLLVGGASFAKRRRRRRRERAGPSLPASLARVDEEAPAAGGGLDSGRAAMIAACALVAMTPFLALAVLSFTRPAAEVLAVHVPYRQTGRLSYSASPPAGPTYPDGTVRTGDPLFTRVVRSVQLAYAYRFESAAPHRLAARASLDATVASTSGWQTTIPLSAPSPLHGDGGVIRARLGLGSLLALISRVEADTDVRGTYTLTIAPRVVLAGEVAGAPLSGTFAPASKFAMDSLEIRPDAANGAPSEPAPASTSFEHSESGSAAARLSRPAHIAIGPISMTVAAARAIALAGLALVACAALAAALVLARPRRRSPTAAILSRYGSLIVPVSAVWQQPGVIVIDVEDIDSLARIADHYERSILHERAEYGDAFWVCDESGQFRYAVLDPLWQAPAAETGWEPGDQIELSEPAHTEVSGPQPLDAHGWAPSPGAPPAPAVEIAAEDLRPSLPAETLQFGAVSPSALAHP